MEKLTIWEVVESSVRKYNDKIAIFAEDSSTSLDYYTLNVRVQTLSSKILSSLSNISYSSDEPLLVSFLCYRNVAAIISILSILSVGATYIPIDPSFPIDRQQYIFTHSKSKLIIVDEMTAESLTSFNNTPFLVINSKTGEIMTYSTTSTKTHTNRTTPAHTPTPDSLAYILYTSGSTGTPKGVCVRNHAVVNTVKSFIRILDAHSNDKILGLTTFCFDISVVEIFLPLFVGGTLILASDVTRRNPYRIVDLLTTHKITILQGTPTTFEMILFTGWQGNRNIACIVGGEEVRPIITRLSTTCRLLVNGYGPTETSIYSSYFIFPVNQPWDVHAKVPIGRAISPSTRLYVVDERMRLVTEDEVEGELYIGGQGVSAGYLHAPELTAQRFIPDPFIALNSEGSNLDEKSSSAPAHVPLMYRTGDLVKRREGDGELIYLNRLDDQVKLSGYRIELSEIEGVIGQSSADIDRVVVLLRHNMLHAYIKLKLSASLRSSSDLLKSIILGNARESCQAKLPPYMVPKRWLVFNTDFPLTNSGKLDKGALPDIEPNHSNTSSSSTPSSSCTTTEAGSPVDGRYTRRDITPASVDLTQFIIQLVHKVTDSSSLTASTKHSVTPSSSFISVGIDSFAAVLFRNTLSHTLRGVHIDMCSLYNPDTTIHSYSQAIYTELQSKHPHLIKELNLLPPSSNAVDLGVETAISTAKSRFSKSARPSCAISSGDDDNSKQGDTDTADGGSEFDRIMLRNHLFLKGIRGVLTILVLLNHFVYVDEHVYGRRLSCDTFLFLILTGFNTLAQDFSIIDQYTLPTRPPTEWSLIGFIKLRFLGLFPQYWLAITLAIPRIIINRYPYSETAITDSEYRDMIILYILGLNTWAKNNNRVLHDLYYVSVLWNVFLIYTIIKLIHHTSNNKNYRLAGYIILAVCIYSSTYYYSALVGPQTGIVYFLVGASVAYALRTYVNNKKAVGALVSYVFATYTVLKRLIGCSGKNKKPKSEDTTPLLPYTNTYTTTNTTITPLSVLPVSSKRGVNQYSIQYIPIITRHLPDILITALLFILLYHGFPKKSAYFDYMMFDQLAFFLLGPALFIAVICTSLLQPHTNTTSTTTSTTISPTSPSYASSKHSNNTIIATIYHTVLNSSRALFSHICESNLLVLLGRCSLPIYLFQILIVEFWYASVIQYFRAPGSFSWRNSDYYYDKLWSYKQPLEIRLIGVFLTVLFGIYIQLYYQEKFIVKLYLKYNNMMTNKSANGSTNTTNTQSSGDDT